MATTKKRFQTYVNSRTEEMLAKFAQERNISQSKAIELILIDFFEDKPSDQIKAVEMAKIKSSLMTLFDEQTKEKERLKSQILEIFS